MTMLDTVEEAVFDELQGGGHNAPERHAARNRHLAAAVAAYVCDRMLDLDDAETQMRFVREAIGRAEGVVALFAEPR